jgi:hypothetical protein
LICIRSLGGPIKGETVGKLSENSETSDYYGRFLLQDKSALAAKILNQVWAT